MPHASLKLIPGVDQNRTPALNEAAISESNLIRFMPDRAGLALPQKLGGWTKYFENEMSTSVLALWAWADIDSNKYLGAGTLDDLFTIENGSSQVRSPQRYVSNPTMAFSTVVDTNKVFIDETGSDVTSFDSIFISTHVSIGGLVLFGFYNCERVTADRYSILSRNVIGLPVDATATSSTGSVASFTTASGLPSVTVTLNDHGLSEGSTFTVLVPVTVGGITLYGDYIVRSVTNANSFVIGASESATSVATASINDGRPRITYYVGQVSLPPAVGYGEGLYGNGGYGSGVSRSGGRSFATTAASCSGTTATLSYAGRVLIPVGSLINVAGVTPAGYNGAWIVTGSTEGATSTVSFTVPSALGTQTVAGSITVGVWDFGTATGWTLDNWGSYLISNPRKGEIYYWSPSDGGTYSAIVPNAPKVNEGCFVAMPERQIIAYGSTFTGIQDPLLVRWCDIGNFTSWFGTVANQAGSFRIPKGSRIVGGMQGAQQGLLWTDLSIWSMQYINFPLVWSFNEIGTGCGLIAQKGAGTLNGTVYWMSQNQFFALSEGGVQPIACPIWDVVFREIDQDNLDRIVCGTNARFGEVMWFYPTTGSGGEPTRYVKYNAQIGQWDYGEMGRTAWIDQSVVGPPIASGTNRMIYQHETSVSADGLTMNAYIQTGYFALEDGDKLSFIDQLWPDMKWGYTSQSNTANVLITFYVVDYPGQTPRVHGPYPVTRSTEYITPRLRGRLVSIRIESNDVSSFWRLGNIRYRIQPDGKF